MAPFTRDKAPFKPKGRGKDLKIVSRAFVQDLLALCDKVPVAVLDDQEEEVTFKIQPATVLWRKRQRFKAKRTLFCLSVRLVSYLSVYPFVCLSIYLSVCLSLCLSLCLSVCLSVCLSLCLSLCLSVCLSICLSASVCLSVCLPISLSWQTQDEK